MKQLFYIFMAVLLMGCAGGSRKSDTAAATPYDSVMQANGYDLVPFFKTRTGHITVTLQDYLLSGQKEAPRTSA